MLDDSDSSSHTLPEWIPEWIGQLALPVWITDPDGNLCYWNEQASTRFGSSPEDVIGCPCHEVVGGIDDRGELFCQTRCQIKRAAIRRSELGPFSLRVEAADGQTTHVNLVVISLWAPDGIGPWLVHLALDAERVNHVETYVRKVAARTLLPLNPMEALRQAGLSRRELEILHWLAQDRPPKEISSELNISYHTVRNHIRHICEKLRVHSTEEAVACYLINNK